MRRHDCQRSPRRQRSRWSCDFILVVATGLWPVHAGHLEATAHRSVATASNAAHRETLRTRCDLLCYFDCQLQCRCRLRTGNARLASRARTFDERCELKFEWFFVFNAGSVAPNLFSNASVDFAALILIIERDVRVLLKNANLAHALRTDAARGHICYASILEMQSHVGDVFTSAKHRHSHRIDTPQGRTHEMQNNFQIMDHQIENDTDVGTAFRVRPEPMRFDEPRMRQIFFKS